jgi:hypothetical protein
VWRLALTHPAFFRRELDLSDNRIANLDGVTFDYEGCE